MTLELPPGIIPVHTPKLREILYGSRVTSFRYELLAHDPATGIDSLIGFLDGVQPGGALTWGSGKAVKKAGDLKVTDLARAKDGLIRVADVNLDTTRIRPVRVIQGMPDTPLGSYVVTASPESWGPTGRELAVQMHDKCTVLAQDAIDTTFTAVATKPILQIIRDVVVSAGERIDIDASETRLLTSPMVWPAGTAKLTIVNELLEILNYNSLWTDELGELRATAYVRPAARSIRYSVLNDENGERIVRKLTDGEESIRSPNWELDRDKYKVPNKVVAVAQGDGDEPPLSGVATNEDPKSPFSFQARGGTYDPVTGEPVGNWLVKVVETEVPDYAAEADPVAATKAFLNDVARRHLIASSSVQAAISVKVLPIPIELLDALMFESTPAQINARHTLRSASIPLKFDGLMGLELLEVIDL